MSEITEVGGDPLQESGVRKPRQAIGCMLLAAGVTKMLHQEGTMMKGRDGIFIAGVFMPVIIGLAGYFNLMGKPRFVEFHTVDVVQLLATGACFGIAFAVMIAIIRRPRT